MLRKALNTFLGSHVISRGKLVFLATAITSAAVIIIYQGSSSSYTEDASIYVTPKQLEGNFGQVAYGQIERSPITESPKMSYFSEIVKSGDNVALIFKRWKIPALDLQELLDIEIHGAKLRRIFPGHKLNFLINENRRLVKLEYWPNLLHKIEFERNETGVFIANETKREPERTITYSHAVIEDSLFLSSQEAGLTDGLTLRLAQIFQWDIDFVLDIRSGDRFFMIYEELYIDNQWIGNGEILAAQFFNQKDKYTAVIFEKRDGVLGHFSPTGKSMRKAFLRAPLDFSRISSNFNLRRKHPLFDRTIPHRGIDYAAPQGTPVLASGDGTISTAAKTEANGNYIVIKHGESIVTKYLHLSKFGGDIRPGKHVTQGQVIGYVGATGWATAPHLHYEFLVNGTHKNPRTVKLPDATPIAVKDEEEFRLKTNTLISMLNSYKEEIEISTSGGRNINEGKSEAKND